METCKDCHRDLDAVGLDKNRIILCKKHAAAPELLAALEGLLEQIENGLLVRNTDGDGASDWAIKQIPLIHALTKANAAIAKAKGGTE